MDDSLPRPLTRAVSLALREESDPRAQSDLLFLEAWELYRPRDLGTTLRASQIRRANPGLAAAIEREVKTWRSTAMTLPSRIDYAVELISRDKTMMK